MKTMLSIFLLAVILIVISEECENEGCPNDNCNQKHLKQITTIENLNGRQIRGFKFDVGWNNSMEMYIGKLGIIVDVVPQGQYVRVEFEDGTRWAYPIELIYNHLVNDVSECGSQCKCQSEK